MEFSSERKQHTVLELYEKHMSSMPLVLKVKQGYYGDLLERPLAKDEILVLAVASKQWRIMSRNQGFFKTRVVSLPTSFGETMCVVDVLRDTYSHDSYLYNILREYKLPVFARLPKNRTITVGHKHYNANDIPGFHLEKSFEEVTLLGNMILEGKVEEDEILAVPIFLSHLRVSIVNGIKGHSKHDWMAYKEKLKNICANVPYDFEYGSCNIAEYDHPDIQFDKDYSKIEPKRYVPIQDFVEIIPPEMIKRLQEEQEEETAPFPQEPPAGDLEDNLNDDYEEIDIPPDIGPKPTVNKNNSKNSPFLRKPPPPPESSASVGAVELPQSEPEISKQHDLAHHRPPPPISKLSKPSSGDTPPSSKKLRVPSLPKDYIPSTDTEEKPVVESGTDFPQVSKDRNVTQGTPPRPKKSRTPPLPKDDIPSIDTDAKPHVESFSDLTAMSKAKKIAQEFQLRGSNPVKAKPPIYTKQKLCETSRFQRNGPENSQQQLKSPTERPKPPPIAAKPKLTDSKRTGTTVTENNEKQTGSEDSYIDMVNPDLSVYEISDNEEKGEYVSLSETEQPENMTNKRREDTNTVDACNVIYENKLPTQVVNPVMSQPRQQTETSVDTQEIPQPESIEASDLKPYKKDGDESATIEISKLSVEDVCDYLVKLHLEKYSDTFIANMVDGVLLLTLDEDVLISEFEMKKIEALRLLRFAREGTLPKLRQQ